MRRLLLPLAVAGTLVLAACGTSTGSAGSGGSQSNSLAGAALVTIADVPGYVPRQANASEAVDFDQLGRGLPACEPLQRYAEQPVEIGRSSSYQFEGTTVDSSTAVYANAGEAEKALEKFRDPAVVNCLTEAYRKAIGPKNVTSISVSPVAAVAPDNGFGYLVTSTGPAPDGSGDRTTLAGIQGVRVGRTISSINVTGTQEKINEIETRVIPAMTARATKAGA